MADMSWTEPESAANADHQPEYTYNNIQQTESGHSFEMDDTPERERVRLQHRSGTFIEMHPNGDEVHKIIGKGYEIIASDKDVLIKGICNITIEGNSVLHVKGDAFTQVDGNVIQNIKGDVTQAVHGDMTQTVDGDLELNASGDITLGASTVNINADLYVRGDVGTSQSVQAEGNISAGLSVSGNKSVETLGYMIAGTTIDAGISVFGPMVSDMFGSVQMFRIKVNMHQHIGNRGFPTSTPMNAPMES
jgi:phage gp45-like